MRKWKQLVGAVLLTVFLIGLGFLDGALLPADNSQIGEAEISSTAAMGALPRIKMRKAQYNDDGELIGCFNTGKNCVIIGLDVAGKTRELLVTADAVMLK